MPLLDLFPPEHRKPISDYYSFLLDKGVPEDVAEKTIKDEYRKLFARPGTPQHARKMFIEGAEIEPRLTPPEGSGATLKQFTNAAAGELLGIVPDVLSLSGAWGANPRSFMETEASRVGEPLQDLRESTREDVITAARDKGLTKGALLAADLAIPLTPGEFKPLINLAAKGAGVGVGVAGALGGRRLARAVSEAFSPKVLDDASAALLRGALHNGDVEELVKVADELDKLATEAKIGGNVPKSLEEPSLHYLEAEEAIKDVEGLEGTVDELLERWERGTTKRGPLKRGYEKVTDTKPLRAADRLDYERRFRELEFDEAAEGAAPIPKLGRQAEKLLERAVEIESFRKRHGLSLAEVANTAQEVAMAKAYKSRLMADEIFPSAPLDDFVDLKDIARQIAIDPSYRRSLPSLFQKITRWTQKNIAHAQGLPTDIFHLQIGAREAPVADAFEVKVVAKQLQKALARHENQEVITKAISDYMFHNGDATNIPTEMVTLADTLRQKIDDLTEILFDDPSIPDKLKEEFIENLGKYSHRDFEVIENPLWGRTLAKNKPEVIQDARKWLTEEYPHLTANEIEGLIDASLAFKHNPFFVVDDLFPSRAGRTVLKPRKNIPEAITKLMGEHTDPVHKAIRSVYYMSQAAAEREFERILAPELVVRGMAHKGPRPIGNFTQPLEFAPGYWVRDDVADLLQQSKLVSADSAAMALNGMLKANTTVLSPATHSRNFISGMYTAMALGHLPFGQGLKEAGQGASRVATYLDLGGDKVRSHVDELMRAGALGTNVDVGDIVEFTNSLQRRLSNLGKVGDWYMALMKLGGEGYKWSDNFWKIYIYDKEITRYQKAFLAAGGNADEALQLAKERALRVVRDGTQNYNFLPKWARRVRDTGVIGPFVSFPVESFRNAKNAIEIVFDDLKLAQQLGSKELYHIAAKRASGIVGVGFSGEIIASVGRRMTGISRQSMTALRDFLPEYHQNSELMPVGQDGWKVRYVVPSDFQYYNWAIDAARTSMGVERTGRTTGEALTDNFLQMAEPLSESLLVSPLVRGAEAKFTGENPIIRGLEEAAEQLTPGFLRAGYQTAQRLPGFREFMPLPRPSRRHRGLFATVVGETSGFKNYEIDVLTKGRAHIYHAAKNMTILASQFKTLSNEGGSPLEIRKTQQELLKEWRSNSQQIIKYVEDLRVFAMHQDLDFPEEEIMKSMYGLLKDEKLDLLQGKVPLRVF